MQVQEKSPLKRLRVRYGLSQERLARLADVTLNTYRSAESGNNVEYTTATKILDALNKVSGMHFTLDDLGLSIV